MGQNPLTEGVVIANSTAIGPATRARIHTRAHELAAIAGRAPHQISPTDYDQARRELMGATDADPQTPRSTPCPRRSAGTPCPVPRVGKRRKLPTRTPMTRAAMKAPNSRPRASTRPPTTKCSKPPAPPPTENSRLQRPRARWPDAVSPSAPRDHCNSTHTPIDVDPHQPRNPPRVPSPRPAHRRRFQIGHDHPAATRGPRNPRPQSLHVGRSLHARAHERGAVLTSPRSLSTSRSRAAPLARSSNRAPAPSRPASIRHVALRLARCLRRQGRQTCARCANPCSRSPFTSACSG